MRITSAGNVGIGTTVPKRGLHLSGSNSVGSPEFQITNTSMVSGGQNFNIAADITGTNFWKIRTLTDDSTALVPSLWRSKRVLATSASGRRVPALLCVAGQCLETPCFRFADVDVEKFAYGDPV